MVGHDGQYLPYGWIVYLWCITCSKNEIVKIIDSIVQEVQNGFRVGGADAFISCLAIFVLVVLAGLIIYGIYSLIDYITSKTEDKTGKIVDKKYVGEVNTTGTAMVSTGTGIGVGVTSSHEDEQYLIFAESNEIIYKLTTNMQFYYHCNIGDRIAFKNRIGGISHSLLSSNL